jgi:hypothetical protein
MALACGTLSVDTGFWWKQTEFSKRQNSSRLYGEIVAANGSRRFMMEIPLE